VRRIGRGTEEKGLVLVITGPAASGKTSVARRIAEQSADPSVHLKGDDFFRALKVGRLRGWEEGSTPQHEVVFEAIGSATRAFANGGYFVVLDSLIRPRYLDILFEAIKTKETELHVAVLRPSLSETQSRSRQRDEADRHSDEILEELHGAFRELGGLESHVIDNTTLDENQTIDAIRSRMELDELRIR
jgi:chloramphenicol 3-O-phosphotransferase